jgi:RNA polymerase sigma-70 factor (ECF subfamily)
MSELELAAERRLVGAARDGDKDSFERLYRAHAGRVYGLCLRLAGNAAEAQDCTQDTFIKAWQSLDSFRGDSRFGTWLHRIAVNQTLGRRRRRVMEVDKLEQVHRKYLDRVPHAESEIEDLEQAIGQLPERARAVFVLQKVYGYTHEETAEMLDLKVGTCKAQVHRASKLLAALLRGEPRPTPRDAGRGGPLSRSLRG